MVFWVMAVDRHDICAKGNGEYSHSSFFFFSRRKLFSGGGGGGGIQPYVPPTRKISVLLGKLECLIVPEDPLTIL